jgi:hypothetical protein
MLDGRDGGRLSSACSIDGSGLQGSCRYGLREYGLGLGGWFERYEEMWRDWTGCKDVCDFSREEGFYGLDNTSYSISLHHWHKHSV